MYIHSNDKIALVTDVIDLTTNKVIERVQWADDETQMYAQYRLDDKGNLIFDGEKVVVDVIKGNFQFVSKM